MWHQTLIHEEETMRHYKLKDERGGEFEVHLHEEDGDG
jgi:hypothetical protein